MRQATVAESRSRVARLIAIARHAHCNGRPRQSLATKNAGQPGLLERLRTAASSTSSDSAWEKKRRKFQLLHELTKPVLSIPVVVHRLWLEDWKELLMQIQSDESNLHSGELICRGCLTSRDKSWRS